jgi:glycosyltransferase involved in cell wall biosynthesis
MIYLDLPSGTHGVGLAGDHLARALSEIVAVERVGSDGPPSERLPGPLLERMRRTFRPTYAATRQIAYSVFDDDLHLRRVGAQMKDVFDMIVPVSRWCEAALRDAGLTAVTLIHQGVDVSRFSPGLAPRQRHLDKFVVFSGGKFELRKGQDIVVRAFKVFSDRHDDVYLVANWHNPWEQFIATMAASPHHPFTRTSESEPLEASLHRWLVGAGVDLDRVDILPHVSHGELAPIYGNSDVGLFPNRCEGGTNLVMMEYMACGRPVVAADYSGHRDVLTEANSIRLGNWRPQLVYQNDCASACWCEPDIEEVIEGLEEAYRNRERIVALGCRAASDLSHWTWDRTARGFLPLLVDHHQEMI